MNMEKVRFGRQLRVLIWRYATLQFNDKVSFVATLLQAPLMVYILTVIAQEDCFVSSTPSTAGKTILFVLCAMAAFMGILNSYREICKEREIILREASVGVRPMACLLSKVVVLFLIALFQGVILTAGFAFLVELPDVDLAMGTGAEVFITVYLILVASTCMGLLISAALKSSESATLPVLFVIISQMVFSGTLFELDGGSELVSKIVVTRWGMSALGASCDLNSQLDLLNLGDEMFESTAANLYGSWAVLALIALVCLGGAYLAMYRMTTRRKG